MVVNNRLNDVQVIYVTPSHQIPTAITAMLLGKDNYQLIIVVSTVVMLLTAITIWILAKLQDHAKTD
jgi:hypothetical protein